MAPLIWAGLLLLLGLVLVVTELFVPTAGLIGFLAAAAFVSGVSLAFYSGGTTTGLYFLLVTAVGLPTVLIGAIRLLPRTPVGRRLIPGAPTADEVLPDTEERRVLRGLLGKIGRAKSPMLPSGAVVVEGRIINAISEGPAIDAGQTIRVVEVRGAKVVVAAVEDEPPPSAPAVEEDPLSKPFELPGFDPDEPLA